MFVYDQLDVITFRSTTGEDVGVLDATVDNVATTGKSTNVLDLEAVVPNKIGQSIYVIPRTDTNGAGIGGTGNPKLIATLITGDTDTPTVVHAKAYQTEAGEPLQIPLPRTCGRYLKVEIASNGGGATNPINKGGVEVFIGQSGL
jgi:hypothetical protein